MKCFFISSDQYPVLSDCLFLHSIMDCSMFFSINLFTVSSNRVMNSDTDVESQPLVMTVSVLVLILQRVSPSFPSWIGMASLKLVNAVHNSNPKFDFISELGLQYYIFCVYCKLLCPRLGQIVHCFGSILLF